MLLVSVNFKCGFLGTCGKVSTLLWRKNQQTRFKTVLCYQITRLLVVCKCVIKRVFSWPFRRENSAFAFRFSALPAKKTHRSYHCSAQHRSRFLRITHTHSRTYVRSPTNDSGSLSLFRESSLVTNFWLRLLNHESLVILRLFVSLLHGKRSPRSRNLGKQIAVCFNICTNSIWKLDWWSFASQKNSLRQTKRRRTAFPMLPFMTTKRRSLILLRFWRVTLMTAKHARKL